MCWTRAPNLWNIFFLHDVLCNFALELCISVCTLHIDLAWSRLPCCILLTTTQTLQSGTNMQFEGMPWYVLLEFLVFADLYMKYTDKDICWTYQLKNTDICSRNQRGEWTSNPKSNNLGAFCQSEFLLIFSFKLVLYGA